MLQLDEGGAISTDRATRLVKANTSNVKLLCMKLGIVLTDFLICTKKSLRFLFLVFTLRPET